MSTIVAVPFLASELSGKVIRVSRPSTADNWDVTLAPSANTKWYNFTATGSDLASLVCLAIAAATGLTVTYSWTWGKAAQLRIQFSGTAEIVLRWTHANTTFDGAFLGFDTTVDETSEGGSDNWVKADSQAQRVWVAQTQVYSFERPRRRTIAGQTLGGKVSWRTEVARTVLRPLFDLVPSPLLYRDAAEDADLATMASDYVAEDPNKSFEAAIWEPLASATLLPIRYTPDSSALSTYHHVQPDLERGGEAWLGDMDAVVRPLTSGEDEAGLLYLMGPMPWVEWVE